MAQVVRLSSSRAGRRILESIVCGPTVVNESKVSISPSVSDLFVCLFIYFNTLNACEGVTEWSGVVYPMEAMAILNETGSELLAIEAGRMFQSDAVFGKKELKRKLVRRLGTATFKLWSKCEEM